MMNKGKGLSIDNPAAFCSSVHHSYFIIYSKDAQQVAQQFTFQRRVTLITDDGTDQHAPHAAMVLRQQDHRVGEASPAETPAIKQRQAARRALKVMAESLAPILLILRGGPHVRMGR